MSKMSLDKIEYFMSQTEKDFDEVKAELSQINSNIDKLLSFRALLLGGAFAISGLVSIAINLIAAFK